MKFYPFAIILALFFFFGSISCTLARYQLDGDFMMSYLEFGFYRNLAFEVVCVFKDYVKCKLIPCKYIKDVVMPRSERERRKIDDETTPMISQTMLFLFFSLPRTKGTRPEV